MREWVPQGPPARAAPSPAGARRDRTEASSLAVMDRPVRTSPPPPARTVHPRMVGAAEVAGDTSVVAEEVEVGVGVMHTTVIAMPVEEVGAVPATSKPPRRRAP